MDGQARGGKDLRGLKALVAFMGVLIVLGTALVIGVIIHRIYAGTATASNISAPAPPVTSPVTAPVLLPAGSHITALAEAGSEFAVSVTGPAGDQLWLVNPQTGAHIVSMTAPK